MAKEIAVWQRNQKNVKCKAKSCKRNTIKHNKGCLALHAITRQLAVLTLCFKCECVRKEEKKEMPPPIMTKKQHKQDVYQLTSRTVPPQLLSAPVYDTSIARAIVSSTFAAIHWRKTGRELQREDTVGC